MTNLKPGHIPNPPTYSRRVDFTFEEITNSCATIWTLSCSLTDVVKIGVAGTKAVFRLRAVTNPSQGEGIAARQELANQRPRPKDSGLIPFTFRWLLRKTF